MLNRRKLKSKAVYTANTFQASIMRNRLDTGCYQPRTALREESEGILLPQNSYQELFPRLGPAARICSQS